MTTISGIEVDQLASFSIGGYTQTQYMSGYDIPMWHCTCGHFLSQCCTGGSCEHIEEVSVPKPGDNRIRNGKKETYVKWGKA